MKILITGGAGFIGSHLAERYLTQGHEVFVLDDLSTGSLDNINGILKDPARSDRFRFVKGSILERELLLELVGTCDVVVHLAAAVGVQYILDNPLSSMVTNIHGTQVVLELCQKFRKKVLLASTSEVYGKHDHAPLRESDDCVYGSSDKFRWSYAASKLMDEFMGLAFHRKNKLPVLVVRFFNTVGPRQTGRYGMVIPRFVQQALAGEPITVYGDGNQTRTFTRVADVVDSLVALLACNEAVGQVVNIGGVEEVSILDLAKRIVKMTESKSEIKVIPYDQAFPSDFEDMQRRVPSTEKLKRLTGKAPASDLDTILAEVIAFFRKEAAGGFR